MSQPWRSARRSSSSFNFWLCLAAFVALQRYQVGPWACVAVKVDGDAAEDVAEEDDDSSDDAAAADDASVEQEESKQKQLPSPRAHAEISQVLVQRVAPPPGIGKLELALERRQTRMEKLERAETESLLREQTALEALEREQATLAKKEVQLEVTQKFFKTHMTGLASKALPHPVSLVQELHNEWYHQQRVESDDDNSTDVSTASDANETSNETAEATAENVKELPKKNKLLLQVINVFGLGFWGVDRCYMDQPWLGLLKAATIGGMTLWAFIDWCVLTVNALEASDTIDAFGYQAQFTTGVSDAFWLAIFNLIFTVSVSCYQCYTAMSVVSAMEQSKGQQQLGDDFELPPAGEEGAPAGKLPA